MLKLMDDLKLSDLEHEFVLKQVKWRMGKTWDQIEEKNFSFILDSLYSSIFTGKDVEEKNTDFKYNIYSICGRVNKTLKEMIQLREELKLSPTTLLVPVDQGDNLRCERIVFSYSRPYGTFDQILWPLRFSHTEDQFFDREKGEDIPWKEKKSMLVFRGTPTGDIFDTAKYPRTNRLTFIEPWILAAAAAEKCSDDDLDLGFSKIFPWIESHPRYDQERFSKLLRSPYSRRQLLTFKYILCLEGNDISSAFIWVLNSNSLVFHPQPFSSEINLFGNHLKPWIHFVPLELDGSDLLEKIQWARTHDDECQKMVTNAHQYMELFRNPRLEKLIALEILNKWTLVEEYAYASGFSDLYQSWYQVLPISEIQTKIESPSCSALSLYVQICFSLWKFFLLPESQTPTSTPTPTTTPRETSLFQIIQETEIFCGNSHNQYSPTQVTRYLFQQFFIPFGFYHGIHNKIMKPQFLLQKTIMFIQKFTHWKLQENSHALCTWVTHHAWDTPFPSTFQNSFVDLWITTCQHLFKFLQQHDQIPVSILEVHTVRNLLDWCETFLQTPRAIDETPTQDQILKSLQWNQIYHNEFKSSSFHPEYSFFIHINKQHENSSIIQTTN